jgi:signal transduction histidine kinase
MGIRSKLVALLTLVALLPLTGALVTIVLLGGEVRREAVGRMSVMAARSEAANLRWILINDLQNLDLALHDTLVIDALLASDTPLPDAQLEQIDQAWRSGRPGDALRERVLDHPIAEVFRRIRNNDPRLVEILLTDRFGQLMAASGPTDAYHYADQDWWRRTHNDGNGQAYVPAVRQNVPAAARVVNLCIPIRHRGQVVGVARASMDLAGWVGEPQRRISGLDMSVAMVASGGRIVYPDPEGRTIGSMAGWMTPSGTPDEGWRMTDNGDIQAHVPLDLPARVGQYNVIWPRWWLVLSVPSARAMGQLYRLSAVVLGIGLVIILAIFTVGIVLVERSIGRRIRMLAGATRQIAEGNLQHRIPDRMLQHRLLGDDEIDELARDFNRMVETIQRSHEELHGANRLKEDFIKIAGHELRTPVTYILASAKLLADSKDPERLSRALQTISFKTRRLEKIIQGMFKLMPSSQELAEIRYQDVDLSQLMEEVYLESLPFLERRNQRLIIDLAPDLPALRADHDKLFDIVSNLVMNAIKFTPNDGEVRVRARSELGERITIAVEDQGPGVPEEELPHIFKPFYTGKDVMKHSTGWSGYQKRGMGLGLAVVKHFLELHGGTIDVQTGPGGSTFTIEIPAQPHSQSTWQ